ncbi:unnamed protein product, partial [Arabidopsis halleri]
LFLSNITFYLLSLFFLVFSVTLFSLNPLLLFVLSSLRFFISFLIFFTFFFFTLFSRLLQNSIFSDLIFFSRSRWPFMMYR